MSENEPGNRGPSGKDPITDKDPISSSLDDMVGDDLHGDLPETKKPIISEEKNPVPEPSPSQPPPPKVTYMTLADRIDAEMKRYEDLTGAQVRSRQRFVKTAPAKILHQLIPSTMSVEEVMSRYQKPIIANTKGLTVTPGEENADGAQTYNQGTEMDEEVKALEIQQEKERIQQEELKKKQYPLPFSPALAKIIQDYKVSAEAHKEKQQEVDRVILNKMTEQIEQIKQKVDNETKKDNSINITVNGQPTDPDTKSKSSKVSDTSKPSINNDPVSPLTALGLLGAAGLFATYVNSKYKQMKANEEFEKGGYLPPNPQYNYQYRRPHPIQDLDPRLDLQRPPITRRNIRNTNMVPNQQPPDYLTPLYDNDSEKPMSARERRMKAINTLYSSRMATQNPHRIE